MKINIYTTDLEDLDESPTTVPIKKKPKTVVVVNGNLNENPSTSDNYIKDNKPKDKQKRRIDKDVLF